MSEADSIESTIAEVQDGIFAGRHRAAELRAALVQTREQLESHRLQLRRSICTLAQLRCPRIERCDKEDSRNAPECSAQLPDSPLTTPAAVSSHPSSTPATCAHTCLTTPMLDFEQYAQAVESRTRAIRERTLLHNAKLQFAEEWARVALPWFERVVVQQFFQPLQTKLRNMEKRLSRLSTRMSLDVQQYTLCDPRKRSGAASMHSISEDDPDSKPSMLKLWQRYVAASTENTLLCNELGPKSENQMPASTRDATKSSSTGVEEDGPSVPAEAQTPSGSVDVQNEEEGNEAVVILSPVLTGDQTPFMEALLRTPRSLRHVWYVMRFGLTDSRACSTKSEGQVFNLLSTSPTEEKERQTMLSLLELFRDVSDKSSSSETRAFHHNHHHQSPPQQMESGNDPLSSTAAEETTASLDDSISKLLDGYMTLLSPRKESENDLQDLLSGTVCADDAISMIKNSIATARVLAGLLTFVLHVRALHKKLRCGRSACTFDCAQELLATQEGGVRPTTDGLVVAQRDKTDQGSPNCCFSPCGVRYLSLQHLVLLPFHYLHAVLGPAIRAQRCVSHSFPEEQKELREHGTAKATAAMSYACKRETGATESNCKITAMSDDAVSLFQWWMSPASCDCRSACARLVQLRMAYEDDQLKKGLQTAEVAAHQQGEADCLSFSDLSCTARLNRLRSAELEIRQLWEELRTRLLFVQANTVVTQK